MVTRHGGGAHTREPVRIVRIIARLNIGGPGDPGDHADGSPRGARLPDHARPRPGGARRGQHGPPRDGVLGVRPVLVPWLRRNPGWRDLPALVALIRIIRHGATADRAHPRRQGRHAGTGGGADRGLDRSTATDPDPHLPRPLADGLFLAAHRADLPVRSSVYLGASRDRADRGQRGSPRRARGARRRARVEVRRRAAWV